MNGNMKNFENNAQQTKQSELMASSHQNMDKKSIIGSLYEDRVTYKYRAGDLKESVKPTQRFSGVSESGDDSCSAKFLSFSIKNSWNSLSQTKCKLWDDKELDVLEGAKFFSYFLG